MKFWKRLQWLAIAAFLALLLLSWWGSPSTSTGNTESPRSKLIFHTQP